MHGLFGVIQQNKLSQYRFGRYSVRRIIPLTKFQFSRFSKQRVWRDLLTFYPQVGMILHNTEEEREKIRIEKERDN